MRYFYCINIFLSYYYRRYSTYQNLIKSPSYLREYLHHIVYNFIISISCARYFPDRALRAVFDGNQFNPWLFSCTRFLGHGGGRYLPPPCPRKWIPSSESGIINPITNHFPVHIISNTVHPQQD